MYKGINLHEIVKYPSKNDPDPQNPTIFHLGALDSIVESYIEDRTTSFEGSSTNPEEEARLKLDLATRNLLTVKFGLKGFEKFAHPETGELMEFETKPFIIGNTKYLVVTDKLLAIFPNSKSLLAELAAKIKEINSLSEEEKKN